MESRLFFYRGKGGVFTQEQRRRRQIEEEFKKSAKKYPEKLPNRTRLSEKILGNSDRILNYPDILHLHIPTLVGAFAISYRLDTKGFTDIKDFEKVPMDDVIRNIISSVKEKEEKLPANLETDLKVDLIRYILLIIQQRS